MRKNMINQRGPGPWLGLRSEAAINTLALPQVWCRMARFPKRPARQSLGNCLRSDLQNQTRYYTPRSPLASQVAQWWRVRPQCRRRGTQVPCLCWEDPLGWEMANHFSILAWKIPLTQEPGGLQSTGLQRVGHDWAHTHTPHYIVSWT